MGQKSPAVTPAKLWSTKPSASSPRKNSLEQTSPGPFGTATKLTRKPNREMSRQTSAQRANKRRNPGSKERGELGYETGFGYKMKPKATAGDQARRRKVAPGVRPRTSHTHTHIVQSIFVLDSYPVENFVLKGQHNSALTFIHAACLEERVFLHLAQNKLHKSKAFLTKNKNQNQQAHLGS